MGIRALASNKSKIVLALVFASASTAVAVGLLTLDRNLTSAAPDVFVSGGGPVFRGSPTDALALASTRSGISIPPVKSASYELRGIDLQDDVDGVRLAVQTAQLRYERKGAKPGDGRLTVYLINGRQAAISAGRLDEPSPVPETKIADLEVVRIDLGESIGFTVWRDGITHHFVFAPPAVSETEMLAVIRNYFD